MRASLAVTLANIWMKSFENQIMSTKEIINKIPKNDIEACPEFNRRVTYRGKAVENVRIGSMQNAKILMINITRNCRTLCGTALIAR